MYILQAQEYYS